MSSNAMSCLPGFRGALSALALMLGAPVLAQSDSTATSAPPPAADPVATPPSPPPAAPAPQPRINLLVTVPRGEANQAQAQQCVDQADAGRISGEIVVCGNLGTDGKAPLTGDRAATQKRYAEETMLKGAPRTPDAFGIPDNGKGIGFGGVPPPAYIVDFDTLPTAPPGSDADRIARGLPPLGRQEAELSEEEEKARREAAGITTAPPPRPKQKGG